MLQLEDLDEVWNGVGNGHNGNDPVVPALSLATLVLLMDDLVSDAQFAKLR